MRRSVELDKWVCQHNSEASLREDLPKLKKPLRKELLEEALTIDEMLELFNTVASTMDMSAAERIVLESYCGRPEIWGRMLLFLEGWDDSNAPSGNVLDHSALFGVFSTKAAKNRPFFRNKLMYSLADVQILYTGQRLFQHDWNLFAVLLMHSDGKLGYRHTITAKEIFTKLELSIHGDAYKLLWDGLTRLRGGVIHARKIKSTEVDNTGNLKWRYERDRSFNFTFLSHFDWNGGIVTYAIDSRCGQLYKETGFSLINWEKRMALNGNELAQKMQILIESQKANMQIHRMAKLIELSDLEAPMKEFKRKINKALNELYSNKIICAYFIEKPKRGKALESRIFLWKKEYPTLDETPKIAGEFFPL